MQGNELLCNTYSANLNVNITNNSSVNNITYNSNNNNINNIDINDNNHFKHNINNDINNHNNNNTNNNNNNKNINNNNINHEKHLYTEEELRLLQQKNNSDIQMMEMSVSDEEDWQEVATTSKKRKNSTIDSNEVNKKSKENNANRFAILSQENEEVTGIKTEPKPPPIFLPGIKNIVAMNNELKRVISNDYVFKCLKDNEIKIMIKSIASYRKVIKHFDLKKKKYYTFQVKQERAYRVVLKNLHHSTPKEDIKNELLTHGHDDRSISNILSRKDKTPLPMFFVDLEPKENNKDIYQINLLSNAVVKFEPPIKSNDLVQCHRCQEFGHTKNYCRKPYKCVKCGLNHATAECKKTLDAPPTCAHCQKNHTSNYKGCQVYQALIRKNNNGRMANTINNSHTNYENNYSNGGFVSYAGAARAALGDSPNFNNVNNVNSNNNNENSCNINNNSSIDSLLIRLEKMINNQNELIMSLVNMMSNLMPKLCK